MWLWIWTKENVILYFDGFWKFNKLQLGYIMDDIYATCLSVLLLFYTVILLTQLNFDITWYYANQKWYILSFLVFNYIRQNISTMAIYDIHWQNGTKKTICINMYIE